MVAKAVKLAFTGLAFAGFVVLLAGISVYQNTQSSKNLELASAIYEWWLTAFQFFGIVISLYAILLDRTKQVAATGLLSVLTVSTFLSLHEHFFGLVPLIYRQLNANGVYAAGIPGVFGTVFLSPATFRNQENRGHITVFAGLVVCAVSNALLTLTIADPVEEVEESPAQDADPSEA